MSRSSTCDISWPITPFELDPVHRRRAALRSPRSTSARGRGRSRTRSAPARARRRRAASGCPAAIARPSTMLCSRGSCSAVTSRARVDASTSRSPEKYDADRQHERDDRARSRGPAARARRRSRSRSRPRPRNDDRADEQQDQVLRLFDAICSYTAARGRPGTGPRTGSSMSKNSRGVEVERVRAIEVRRERLDRGVQPHAPGRCRTAARRRSSTRCR